MWSAGGAQKNQLLEQLVSAGFDKDGPQPHVLPWSYLACLNIYIHIYVHIYIYIYIYMYRTIALIPIK